MNSDHKLPEVFDITAPWLAGTSARRVACLLCGGRNLTPLNTFLLNGVRFRTVRCVSDGMMWLDPQPTEEFYRQLYAQHYHTSGEEDPLIEQATLDVHSDEARLRQIASLRLDEIESFGPPGCLLEVGFGSGHVLLEARARGWEVTGIEAAHSCVDAVAALGIAAECTSLLGYTTPAEPFDVIAMYSVIEHTLRPAAYLQRAYHLLQPDGLLVLRLPDTQPQGPPASLIAHPYHFSKSTICELLRRCGFETIWIGSFNVWRPTRYPGELWSMNVISRKVPCPTRRS